ncbi:hypothetical protein GALMADRAFT_638090 [Galerina marginata CBS 339.88]|uniref:Uncharacterized protein n=1 Tax=Galerina marginata (strain CBS 339.88) TaxID=685588 RepID=A0A067TJH7_GALM3|nr:hypothetical protein GALMADRAFT_638090 [Galerina marginata CBS 339.88]
MDTPSSSPLTLGPPLDDMGDFSSSYTGGGLNKIAECGHDASQEDQVIQCRLDALPSVSCQRKLPDFNGVLMTAKNSFEKSESSDAEASLNPSQQNLVSCERKTVPGLSRLRDGETQVNCALSRAVLSEAPPPENTQSFESGHLTTNSSSMDPDFSQISYTGVVRPPAFSTSQSNSALLSFSSTTMNPDLTSSHRVDVEPCEQSPSSLVESFKSTGGHSDDILPRAIFNGKNEELETDTTFGFSKDPESHAEASIPLMLNISTTLETIHPNPSQNASHFLTRDPDTSITDFSLTLTGQIDQSHEETGTGCVSDHFNVPSSSPIAHTQSDPYFTPATIFRARSPDFRTDVVGIQELASSSPPSSPSMTSNYMPSSSPIPSSSPMEGPNRTPPSSPPATTERYIHNSSATVQEPFYEDEVYAAFPHYSMDHRPYQALDRVRKLNFSVSSQLSVV